MKAVASRVTDPKTDMLLLPAVDMDDSGPYEIAEPRAITALETYAPAWLQTPRIKRLAQIVSAQASMQQNGGIPPEENDSGVGADKEHRDSFNGEEHGHFMNEDGHEHDQVANQDQNNHNTDVDLKNRVQDWSRANGAVNQINPIHPNS